MRIIKIEPFENGGHDNQTIYGKTISVPDGWAVIPDEMEIPDTFPFVNIEVEDGVVTNMTEDVLPDPEPEIESAPTQLDKIEAQVTYTAMMTDTLLEV